LYLNGENKQSGTRSEREKNFVGTSTQLKSTEKKSQVAKGTRRKSGARGEKAGGGQKKKKSEVRLGNASIASALCKGGASGSTRGDGGKFSRLVGGLGGKNPNAGWFRANSADKRQTVPCKKAQINSPPKIGIG